MTSVQVKKNTFSLKQYWHLDDFSVYKEIRFCITFKKGISNNIKLEKI